MKKLFFTLIACVSFISIYGQVPQAISYQGVARNSSGTLLANQNIGIKLDLHQGSSAGTVVFSETHNKTTNAFGLFTLGIGSVNTTSFTGINWANGPYFLEVSIDPTGGSSFTSVGTQQFMSVPYALYAQTSGNASPTITINAPNTVTSSSGSYIINVPAAISYSAGTGINITGGVISNTAIVTTPTIVGTGATTVTSSGNTFTVNSPMPNVYTAGTGIDITGGVISNTAAVSNPTINSGGVANVTNPSTNVYLVDVPAPSINYNPGTNELTLTQNGATSTATLNGSGSNTISIVGNGLASVTPTSGSTFTVSVPNPTLALNSNSLSISGGNTVLLPPPTSQSLTVNSNSLSISGGNTVTIPTTSVVSTNTNISVSSSAGVYSLTVVTPTLNVTGGSLTGSYPSQTLTIPTSSTTVLTASTGVVVTGTAPSYTLSSPNQSLTISSNSLSITGGNTVVVPTSSVVAGNSNITVTPSGNTYSVSAASYSLTSNSNTLTLSNGSAITTATVPTTVITGTGTGIATATTSANNFTVNVPAPTYTATTGVLAFGTNTIGISPTLSLTGTTLQSGPSTNTINLSSINNWSVSSGVIYPSTLTNSVGIGTSGPLTDKMEINFSSSPTNTHLHLKQTGADAFSRLKFSNSIASTKYWLNSVTSAAADASSGYNFFYYNGSVGRNLLTVSGDGKVSVNPFSLSYPTLLEVNGGFEADSTLAVNGLNAIPPVSAINSGKLYYDRTTNKFKVSENGGAYVNLVPGFSGAWSLIGNNGTNTTSNFIGTIDKVGLNFKTNNADRLFIDTIGRIGIGGNSNPVTFIHAKSDYGLPYILLENAANSGGFIVARSGGGSLASPTYNPTGMNLGGFGIGGYNITNFGPSAVMHARSTELWNATSRGTALHFETTQNGSLTLITKMLIDHNGYVGINTYNNYSNPLSMLHVETDGSLDKGLRVSNSGSTTNGPSIYLDGQNQDWTITGSNAGNGSGANKFVIRDYSNAADRFVIDNNGNVGIGTTFPINKFHVNGSMAITDGTQGVGKVLVSDASGNASWMPIMKITYGSASCQSVASVSTTPVKFNTNLGSVVKSYSDTHLEVILQTDLNVFDLVGANAVTYELKVNGTSANGNTGKAVYFVDNANAFNTFNNKGVTITAEFDGLTSGTYNVELWVYCASGSALNVYIDPGCFGASSVIIKEFK